MGHLFFAKAPGGQAEVGEHGFAVFINQHVGGLHVAVDDAFGMGVGERLRHFADDAGRVVKRQAAFVEERFKRLSLDKRAGDEVAIAITAGLEEGNDVGMPQIGCCFGFAQETLDAIWSRQRARLGDLQGYFAIELRIVGAEDFAEGAFA